MTQPDSPDKSAPSQSYVNRRTGVWIVQVRKLHSNEVWGYTGADYHSSRKLAIESITPNPWPDQYEYRAVRYYPAKGTNPR